MSTTESSRQSRHARPQPIESAPSAGTLTDANPLPPKRRKRIIIALILLLLVSLAWFAPSIAANLGMIDSLVHRAVPELRGKIHVESASLGWFSTITLTNVELFDAHGDLVVAVPEVSGNRTLWQLLNDSTELGTWRMDRPQALIVSKDQTTNIEEIIAPLLESTEPSTPRSVRIEMADATATLRTVDRLDWSINGLSALVVMSKNGADPLQVSAQGNVATKPTPAAAAQARTQPETTNASGAGNSARFEIAFEQTGGAATGTDGELTATIRTSGLPLAITEMILPRVSPGTHVDGTLESDCQIHWTSTSSHADSFLRGTLDCRNFRLSTPGMGRDELALARLTVPCRIGWQSDRIVIEDLGLETDFARIRLKGSTLNGAELADAISTTTGELNGEFDLARLATMLPDTLRILPGTRIEQGTAVVRVASHVQNGQRLFQGRIETSDLVATNNGQRYVWRSPVTVEAAARTDDRGVIVDQLSCQSSFMQLQAKGTTDDFTAYFTHDMGRLAQELSGFVDLTGYKFAGQGTTQLTWKRTGPENVQATLQTVLQAFELSFPGRRPWREERLAMNANLAGTANGFQLGRLDSAWLTVESGGDRCQIQLTQPVSDIRGALPMQAQLQGELSRWLARLDPWVPAIRSYQMTGDCQATAVGSYSPQQIQLTSSKVSLQKFRAAMFGLNIDEPKAEVELAGTFDLQNMFAKVGLAVVRTTAISAQGEEIHFNPNGQGGPEIDGRLAFRSNLNRLAMWFMDPRVPATWGMSGDVQGQAQFARRGDGFDFTIDSTGQKIVYATVPVQVAGRPPEAPQQWAQEQMRLVGKGRYDSATDQLSIQSVDLALPSVRVTGNGQVARLTSARLLEMAGKVDYDLARLNPLIHSLLSDSVTFAGAGSRPWRLRMPLSTTTARGAAISLLQQIEADASVAWSNATLYGVQIGQGEVAAKVDQGFLRVSPIDLVVSGGRVLAAPTIRLAPEPRELTMSPGRVIQQLEITPEMCKKGLQYAAPLLASATQVSGRFSVDVERCRMNLTDATKSDLTGKLTVHNVEIGIGDAPLIREIAALFNYRKPAHLSRESVVQFTMVDGRVWHKNLELQFDNLIVRTQGYVDVATHAVNMTAEMPLPPSIVNRIPVPAIRDSLKDRVIMVPIGGNLLKPQIDQRIFENFLKEVVGNGQAVKSILERETGNLLDKVFGPGPQPKQ